MAAYNNMCMVLVGTSPLMTPSLLVTSYLVGKDPAVLLDWP